MSISFKQRPISFLLNGEAKSISPEMADETLLNWLRKDAQLHGSKEGCAEGDCGACSVLITRQDADGTIRHEAANACILFLPMLDGLVVTTVEYVAGPDGALHPVQAAMVEYHGSQCGFCTPGFILSLLAGWRSDGDWDRQSAEDLIAGNLCRCTGYGPIITAATTLSGAVKPDWEIARMNAELQWLNDHHQPPLATENASQPFLAPETIDDLSDAIAANPNAQIIAGATDIGLWVTKKHVEIMSFISLMRVPALQQITEDDHGFTIGAGVSHAQAKLALAETFPPLDELWRRFGSAQVRASGTVCGNIANGSPIGDLAPAFLALNAILTLRHGRVERTMPLDDFYLDYMENALQDGEWVKSIYLPKLAPHARFYAFKISRRFDQDISAVMGAFYYAATDNVITNMRIGFGGMAAIPARAKGCEAALIGVPLDGEVPAEAMAALDADFTPLSDMRASASYRQIIAQNLLKKALAGNAMMLAGNGLHDLDLDDPDLAGLNLGEAAS